MADILTKRNHRSVGHTGTARLSRRELLPAQPALIRHIIGFSLAYANTGGNDDGEAHQPPNISPSRDGIYSVTNYVAPQAIAGACALMFLLFAPNPPLGNVPTMLP